MKHVEKEIGRVTALIEAKDYVAASAALDGVLWGQLGRRSRIEYLRGVCYAALGDDVQAERQYRRAIEEDSRYFWAHADLAILYASKKNRTALETRELEVLTHRLRHGFAMHHAQPRVLSQIERRLASGPEFMSKQDGPSEK